MAPVKVDSSKTDPVKETFMEYSIPLDPSKYGGGEYFCRFVPRIHRDAHLADAGALQCQIDFLGSSEAARAAAIRNEHKDRKSYAVGCINPVVGNFTALCACEAIPERLALTTYMVEYAYIHDDVIEYAEEKEESQLWEANEELIEGLSLDSGGNNGTKEHVRRRQLQAKMAVEMMDIDTRAGKECLRLWKEMSDVFVNIRDLDFKILDNYLQFRVIDAGCPWTMSLLCFSMDFTLTAEEIQETSEVTAAAYDAWVLVNDYFSWHKEWKNFQDNACKGEIVSAVYLFMKWNSLDWPEARTQLRAEIIKYEERYCRAKAAFMARGISTSRIAKWFDLLDLVTAGNFAWSMTTARYDEGQENPYPALRAKYEAVHGVNFSDTLYVPISSRISKALELEHQSSDSSLLASGAAPLIPKTPPSQTTTEASAKMHDSAVALVIPVVTNGKHGINGTEQEPLGEISMDPALSAHEDLVLQPLYYLESMPSKGVRGSAIDGLESWYQVPEHSLSVIRYIVNTLHSSSLMLDDIQDQSHLRRGFPSTHMVYGVAQTINAANLLMFKAMQAAQQLSSTALQCLTLRILGGHIGQGLDLHWTRQTEIPTEEDYFVMVDGKTGGLFVLLTELMRSEATSNKALDLSRLMKVVGRFFQARDDYQNIEDAQYEQQKGFAEDISEGKMSLPIIHALLPTSDPSITRAQNRLLNVLQQRKTEGGLSLEVRRMALDDIKACYGLARAKDTVLRLQGKVEEILMQCEKNAGSQNWILRLMLKRLEI